MSEFEKINQGPSIIQTLANEEILWLATSKRFSPLAKLADLIIKRYYLTREVNPIMADLFLSEAGVSCEMDLHFSEKGVRGFIPNQVPIGFELPDQLLRDDDIVGDVTYDIDK